MAEWDSLKNGDRVELALVQVDIAGHSKLAGTDRALMQAKAIFRKQMQGIAETRGGRLFSWAGDGGAFMFLTGDGGGFDDLAFSSFQMLSNMPAINEEISTKTDLDTPFEVRISCDSGIATYTLDPGEITGDFINRFMKYERALGLLNTVSVTDRVWKQLTAKVRARFDLFKLSPEVESKVYNYGGKDYQRKVLRSLQNIEQDGRAERPPEQASFVEVLAFAGDTLADLSREAYADVIVEGFENVGGINLLISKNGQRCQDHIEHSRDKPDVDLGMSCEEQLLCDKLLSEVAPDIRNQLTMLLTRVSACDRKRIFDRLHHGDTCDAEYLVQELMIGVHGPRLDKEWRDPTTPFSGGESLRFYNTTALGYVPEIGDGTLLDNVFARHLTINRVIGGVIEPIVKQRIFEFRDGEYKEVESLHEDDGENNNRPDRTD